MNDEIHGYYIEAGKIAAEVRKEAVSRIKEDVTLLEVAEYAENRILELGGKPAFPCNISLNEIASHYTPEDDLARFRKGDVIKLDLGVHVEGYIADTAKTIEIGTNAHAMLIKSCEEALEKAILSIRHNARTQEIGKIIETTIKNYGFNPVRDLTGHNMERYKLHAGVTIPNYGSMFGQKIKKDMVFAIEPFATYGSGDIKYGKARIFAMGRGRRKEAKRDMFDALPFTRRWIPGKIIQDMKGVREYLELIEPEGRVVAQAEHTVIVNEDGCEIITS